MRRIATAITATFLVSLLATAAPALARGGSGSSSFGRGFGGGGGGGGGRGFGRGHFFFLPLGGGSGILLLIVIAVIVFWLLPRIAAWDRGRRARGRAHRRAVAQRQRRVELAAAVASEEDESFAPDAVREAARRLFLDIQQAWSDDDRGQLRALVAPDLLAEWQLRLDDFARKGWRNRVKPLGDPKVSYIGLRNVEGERNDRVVVLIEATLLDYVEDSYGQRIGRVDNVSDTSRVREYWTLTKQPDDSGPAHSGEAGRRAGRRPEDGWILLSIEQGTEGDHALADELITSADQDDTAMRDEALIEGAVADAVPAGTSVAEVADLDFEGDARAAALDLSLADGRFAPDVLEIAARRAVAAWAEAVDGDDAALEAIAHPEAVQHLLHPGDPSQRTRLVVRGPKITRIRITGLDAAAAPPTMTIEVEIAGRRYIEDRDTAAMVAGTQSRSSSFTEHWTMALDGDPTQPWRIASVATPVGHR
jgi:predicted lipid-binding transport protein (Tim44 family)